MLRVEVHDASNTTWPRVDGRFVGAFAEDTKAMVVRCKLPSHLVVDLSEVTFVDAESEEVLLWLACIGALLVANSCYALDVCEKLHLPILQKRGSGRPRARREDACQKSG